MFINFFLLNIFALLSIFSIIGYGKLFHKVFFYSSYRVNFGLLGFFGLLFITFISYFTHLFLPHNYFHNSVIFIVGLLFFFYFFNLGLIKIDRIDIFIFLLLYIGIFVGKSNDDFGYYHLPNAIHFSENKLEFGLGNLNHGFKHHSSLFYIYSVFNLPLIKFYLFNVLNFLFLFFSTVFLSNNINLDIKNLQFNKYTFIKLTFLVLIISIFNRVGAYGTDITGQLLGLVIICLSLDFISKKKINKEDLLLLIVLTTFLFTIKTSFVIYFIFPTMFFLLHKNRFKIFKNLIISKSFLFLSLMISLFIFVNISSTGCIVYPISNLCFPDIFSWGLDEKTVNVMSSWYEIWSKAGAGPDFRMQDPLNYIQNLNWLNNWIDRYFFNKVTDFLFSISIGIIIIFSIFRKNIKLKINFNIRELYLFIVLTLLVLIWFFNFPSLRYGGYILILSLIIIFLSFLFELSNLNIIDVRKKVILLFSISILVFVTKNIIRIKDEFNYSAINYFKSFPFFYVENVKFTTDYIGNEKVHIVTGMCWATPSPCLRNKDIKIFRNNKYRFFLNK